MATTKISTGVLKDGSVTSAKLDTNISIVGDLTVDTNTLFVDSASNRVGIGTSSPASKLHITGSGEVLRLQATDGAGTAATARMEFRDSGNSTLGFLGYISSGNSDLSITNIANADMRFLTNDTERMRIDSSGNVLVGTTSDTTFSNTTGSGIQFMQNGIISAARETTDSTQPLLVLNSTGVDGHQISLRRDGVEKVTFGVVSDALTIKTDGTERMRIASNGNVGIGTSSPDKILTLSASDCQIRLYDSDGTNQFAAIQSDSGAAKITSRNGNSSGAIVFQGFDGTVVSERMRIDSSGLVSITRADSSAQLKLERTGTGTGSMYIGADSIGFKVFDNSFTPRLVVESIGNVGIGTTPSAWGSGFLGLDLKGSTAANIGGVSRTRFASNIYYDGSNFRLKESYGGAYYFQDAVANIHTWGTAATGTGGEVATLEERMRIAADGNVGIGTSSPIANLQIGDYTGVSRQIALASSTTGNCDILFGDGAASNSSYRGVVRYDHTGENMQFWTASTERMRLESDGDLHVDGDVIAYSTTISDQRLKDDIQTIDNALDKVSNLRGVSYTWNNGSRKGQKDLGLIAQEVEQVLPELVREKEMPMIDGGTYKTVDYEKIVGVLIEAVKELKAEVELLKSK